MGMTEKGDLVNALKSIAELTSTTPLPSAPSDAEQVQEDGDDDDDDDDAMLAQALLMSQETEDSLTSLSIRELRERCHLRGVQTAGMTTKAELVSALFNGNTDELMSTNVPPSMASEGSATQSDVQPAGAMQVLASFGARFACFAAMDIPDLPGAAALEQTGKVLLPRSCLAGLAFLSSLPTTMLLRLSLQERTVYVGVADFVDDALAFETASAAGCSVPRWGPGAAGVAAVFVPRWVRSQLAVSDDTVGISLVSMPKAAAIALQPHTDAFAEALGRCPDPRAVMTELMNRYVAVAVGDVIHLSLPSLPAAAHGEQEATPVEAAYERHALDVVMLRGLPGSRCGLPEGIAPSLDVAAAIQSLNSSDDPARGIPVRAACIVDADVECEFLPSLVTAAREAAELEARAERAAKEARALAQKQEAEQAERARLAAAESAAIALRQSRRAAAQARLPPEPAASATGVVEVALRFPDGTRLIRRFDAIEPLASVFDAVEASSFEALAASEDLKLVASYPRRVWTRREVQLGQSLQDAGLTNKQEALFVE